MSAGHVGEGGVHLRRIGQVGHERQRRVRRFVAERVYVGTTSLDGPQWLICLGLALIVPLLVEGEKAVRRRRLAKAGGR